MSTVLDAVMNNHIRYPSEHRPGINLQTENAKASPRLTSLINSS